MKPGLFENIIIVSLLAVVTLAGLKWISDSTTHARIDASDHMKTEEMYSRFSAESFGAAASNPGVYAVFETSLAAPMNSSDTALTLASNSVNAGGATLPNGRTCFTIDQGTSVQEFVCGNVVGTAVSDLLRGVSPLTGTTTDSAYAYSHRRGADVKITDWPTLGILNNQMNGVESIPNLLQYSDLVNVGPGSPTTTIPTKFYVDNIAVSGAPDADDTTKGIVQMATGAEAAAGTALGSTGARLSLGANIATALCNTVANTVLVASSTTGKLNGNCLDTLSNIYTWGKLNIFNSGIMALASTTVGSGTQSGGLYISGGATSTGYLVVTNANATSSTAGNLQVLKNSTTTNLTISGRCVGCANGYERVSNTGAGPTAAANQAAVTTSCTAGKKVIGGGGTVSGFDAGKVTIADSFPASESSWTATFACYIAGGGCAATTITTYAICVNP